MRAIFIFLMLTITSMNAISSGFYFREVDERYTLKVNVSDNIEIEYILPEEIDYYLAVERDLTILDISLKIGGVKKAANIVVLSNEDFDLSDQVENAQSIESSGYCLNSHENFIAYNDTGVDRAILGNQGVIISVGGDKSFLKGPIVDVFPEMEGCLDWI